MKTHELLGYPPDARLLILNIDDYGLCFTANDAASNLLHKKAASSVTVMTPAPWGLHGVGLLQANPGWQCGVHLTAISEHLPYRWGPRSDRANVPSLVDEEGYFYLESRQDHFYQVADIRDLEREFRTQIEFVLSRGVQPTHLDSHCNVQDGRAEIFALTVLLALEYGLALRVHNPENFALLRAKGLPATDYPDLDSFRIPLEGKFQTYLRMLRELPEGLSEWGVHPAYESAELRAITPEWPVRATDYEFFNSEIFLQTLHSEGIQLVQYSLLQPFWSSAKRS
jgi:hypothetical protein